MIIELTKVKENYWKADLLDLIGSPPIGIGKTKHEAVGSLFSNLMHNIDVYKLNMEIDEKLEFIIKSE